MPAIDTRTPPHWYRQLLPGELHPPRGNARSARNWIVDIICTLVPLAFALSSSSTTEIDWRLRWASQLLGLVAIAALWWRRRNPDRVLYLTSAIALVSMSGAGIAQLIALFNGALRGSRRAVIIGLVASLLTPFTLAALFSGNRAGVPLFIDFGIAVVMSIMIVGWALLIRAQREQLSNLRERAEQKAAEQRLREEQARLEERRRIAREMHDVLAHRVSLLSLHAGALEYRPDAPPEEIAQAAGVIRETAHAALGDLREVLGVLRDDPGADPQTRPQPTLQNIPDIVVEGRAAGMEIDLTFPSDPAALSATVGRTAYRTVQEGLTNARKHAPHAHVSVTVAESDALTVQIVTRQPVGATVRASETPPGAGMGLTGLAERVALAGGRLSYGPDANDNFVLRAELPL